MPTITRDGADLYYEVHGSEGPGLVFAHGRGGNAASWWQQIPHYRDRFRVVVFDHRGFGRSRCDTEDFDVRRFGPDLVEILDACGIHDAALVCQSMGGRTGLQLALEHPERVTCLVLACTPGGLDLPEAREASLRRVAAGEQDFGNLAVAAGFPGREPGLAALYDQIRAFNDGCGPAGLDAQAAAAGVDPARLDGYRLPTLLVTGSEDRIFPPEVIRAVAACIPGSELVEVEGAGHSVYFEDAARFNALLDGFLARHAA